nr:lon protease-like [Lytechinus pictus]
MFEGLAEQSCVIIYEEIKKITPERLLKKDVFGVRVVFKIEGRPEKKMVVSFTGRSRVQITGIVEDDDLTFAEFKTISEAKFDDLTKGDLKMFEKSVDIHFESYKKFSDFAKQFPKTNDVATVARSYFNAIALILFEISDRDERSWAKFLKLNKLSERYRFLIEFKKEYERFKQSFEQPKDHDHSSFNENLKNLKDKIDEIESNREDISDFRQQLASEPYPERIKKKINKELDRLDSLPPISSEKKESLGQIVCLVGPPGVGKTSLGCSIASAIKRKFARISLGGVKDEAEIRGHRRTYIGALPGKIIQALKKTGVNNPVILIDEIDKLSSDFRGDPSSAMLEVFDPAQNSTFTDHFIEEPFDLSNVLFIATANYEWNIPAALYDRLEIIHLSSYTESEKAKIAENHLIPEILNRLSLKKTQISFTQKALLEIIKYYTREAGVRELERLLIRIARQVIIKLLSKEIEKAKIDAKNIESYLEKRRFTHTEKEKKSVTGVVTGLAYTSFGGDILPIEANIFEGKENLILTGKLGEVMRESAKIALNYVKSNWKRLGLKKGAFENKDIHIHVPEGAVPKDGPSAGIALTSALVSLLSGVPVSRAIGMTGEITLRGKVLPIGGLKEKSIAAGRSENR